MRKKKEISSEKRRYSFSAVTLSHRLLRGMDFVVWAYGNSTWSPSPVATGANATHTANRLRGDAVAADAGWRESTLGTVYGFMAGGR